MAETSLSTSHELTAEQFNDMAFREYVDKLVLKPYMGTDSESMIHVNENLSKAPGDAISFGLVSQIDGAGVEGDSAMEGNEESFSSYAHRVSINVLKNGILLGGDMTEQRSPYDIKMECKPNLTTWLAQKIENKMFDALASIDGVVYGSASETQKDAWLAANSDRVLFGAAVSNNAGNDHSTCLSEVDTSADVLTTATISLAKRLAQLSDPKIRPIKLQNGEEWYVMFVHPLAARDLKNTDAWKNAQQYARLRGDGNNIFTGALGEWDGVVLIESPKCLYLDNVGASATTEVAASFLCGSQALLYAQGGFGSKGRVTLTEKMFDYDSKWGCQIKTMFGVEKAKFNSKQHGVVTVYTSAMAD